MDDYAGRVLADRYRLPLPPSEAFELVETRAFDTYSGQEVLVRQIPLPEVVDAEVLGDDGPHGPHGPGAARGPAGAGTVGAGARRTAPAPGDPAVRRALAAATAAAQIPDHPRLDQVFHVFAEAGSLWIVSELVSARPLAALLAERTLSPHRAAEVAADVLTALRALHAQGWTHRNITARTVLICDDGRAILTGLAAGAAEEALCGYDPVPETAGRGDRPRPSPYGQPGNGAHGGPGARAGGVPRQGGAAAAGGTPAQGAGDERDEARNARAARSGAIAAYHAAARAAARAAVEGTARPAAGASTWGGGSASSGTAPAPGTTRPWNANGLVRGGPGPGGAGGPAAPGQGGPGGPGRGGPGGLGQAGQPAAPGQGGRPGVPAQGPGVPARGGRPAALGQGGPGVPGQGKQSAASGQGNPAVPDRREPAVPGQGGPGARDRDRQPTGSAQGGPAVPDRGAQPAVSAQGGPAGGPSSAPGGRSSNGWGHPKGPADALAAERARQARMVVVGAVTERWAPEQAWPVQENWQLAPPVGPAADLWALGALLFRVVQGHAPYPEESTAELVQVVCAEPPAYAEECGALRPVVESLMRKDPAERPEFEELRGWLRSLIRSAPEPELGSRTVTVPSIGAPAPGDPRRLPVVRRRGELVRRRRGRASAQGAAAGQAPASTHGRHKRTAGERHADPRAQERSGLHTTGRLREERVPTASASPLRLGRLLLGLILLALIGAVLYAVLFMPRAGEGTGRAPVDRTGAAGALSAAPGGSAPSGTTGRASTDGARDGRAEDGAGPGAGAGAAKGFALRKDPKGFAVAVAEDWRRRGENERGQVVYAGGDYELIVVPGRDTVAESGGDPMAYQQDKEPELAPYRSSSWSGSSGLRRVDVGGTATAEGTFHWYDSGGRQIYVRNAAMILGDRYHLLQVRGPMDEQRSVDTFFEQAMATYRANG